MRSSPRKGTKAEKASEETPKLREVFGESDGGTRHHPVTATPFKNQNLRGQTLLFRCLETGFIMTAPALSRYQQGRDIDPSRRELVGQRPANWVKEVPTSTCEHCGMLVKGNQCAYRQHQQTKRCQASRGA